MADPIQGNGGGFSMNRQPDRRLIEATISQGCVCDSSRRPWQSGVLTEGPQVSKPGIRERVGSELSGSGFGS